MDSKYKIGDVVKIKTWHGYAIKTVINVYSSLDWWEEGKIHYSYKFDNDEAEYSKQRIIGKVIK